MELNELIELYQTNEILINEYSNKLHITYRQEKEKVQASLLKISGEKEHILDKIKEKYEEKIANLL